LIEEGILGECLRCSSSLSGLRISPLTLKYVLPRTTLLHSWAPTTRGTAIPGPRKAWRGTNAAATPRVKPRR